MSHHRRDDDDGYMGYNPRVHSKVAEKEGFQLGNNTEDPKTLWIGNLDPAITDDFLSTLFNQMGAVTRTKIIFDGLADPYAFIEFSDHYEAAQALQAMNKRLLLEREMRVNWALEPGHSDRSKSDTARHFHVFVGDLSPEVDSTKLREAFIQFGDISEAKVIRDTATNKSKGYGFVSYPKREEAERAIEQMNGQWLGRRTIRTNWASRKPGDDRPERQYHQHHHEKSFEEVYALTTPDNTSVYVGNIKEIKEEEIREAFAVFGAIIEVRMFNQQGYAFVKFEEKTSAAKAIVQMNNQEINGQAVRCKWGKSGEYFQNGSSKQPGGAGSGGFPFFSGGPSFNVPPPSLGPPPGYSGYTPGGPPPTARINGQALPYPHQQQQSLNNPQVMQTWSNYWAQQRNEQTAPSPPQNFNVPPPNLPPRIPPNN
ncbi:unnamed protein product [Caenorhabditis sp. 36 PRJEB53466]|nr:unnamed protein product [Caenorhabditis sp. 36 PRJEB53466]